MAYAVLAAARRAFDGTHPVFKHSPPIRPRSTRITLSPSSAAPAETDRPAAPAPITQRSTFLLAGMTASPHVQNTCVSVSQARGSRFQLDDACLAFLFTAMPAPCTRRLLRAGRERPRRRAADQRDEPAPFQLTELHAVCA